MSMVTPTLNLPLSTSSSTASMKAAAATPAPAALPTPAAMPSIPSTTVTLSPQALSAMAASHAAPPPPSSMSSTTPAPAPVPAPTDSSIYDSIKNGIASAVGDVGDAIEGGAHAVVDGVETVLSTANNVVKGALELPFAAVAKVCDAAGDIIDTV